MAPQPTSRAPGTGPCTARTVRKTPAPASAAASRTAPLVVGERGHRRAGAAQQRPDRTCVGCRRQCAPQLRTQHQRGRLQVVVQRRGQRGRRPLRSAAITGSAAGSSVPSGTRPAARIRSSSRRRPGSRAPPPRCRGPSPTGVRDSTGVTCSPRPSPEPPRPEAEGHVAAQPGGEVQRGPPGRRGCPTARPGRRGRPPRRRCRPRAPRRPGSTWRSRGSRRRSRRRTSPAARRPARRGCGGRRHRSGPAAGTLARDGQRQPVPGPDVTVSNSETAR